MDFLKKYISEENVEKIVIGKPTQPNGAPSENLARVEAFVKRWRKEMPAVPIVYYDERFTSVLAHRAIIEGGVKKKTRRENKGLVDEVSATIILQDFTHLYLWTTCTPQGGSGCRPQRCLAAAVDQ